jgi:type II secretory pathway pseudopilin PulG
MTHTLTMQRNVRSARRGFSFTEVLFAVMVLGIGFIMIAAMFPVTIRQTQNTMGDTQGANEAQAAMAYLQSIGTNQNFPPTVPGANKPAQVYTLKDVPTATPGPGGNPGYVAAKGNMVNPNSPRLAWLPLYRRGVHTVAGVTVPDSFAQVFVIAVQSRNRPQYNTGFRNPQPYSDFDVPPNATPANGDVAPLDPKPVEVTVVYNSTRQRGELQITTPNPPPAFAAPGAYVIIADDPNDTEDPLKKAGQSNGRIYQLGEFDEQFGVWTLMPGSDMIRKNGGAAIAGDDNDIKKPAKAYMVGRGYTNPFSAADGYSGPAQELGVYTGYIQISPDIVP